MTISSNNRIIRYTGSGTSTFSFTFKVFQASDIQVIKQTISTGVETVLALNTDYSVALNNDQNNNPGGSITTTVAVTSSFYITITSAIDNFQPTDLSNQGGFYPDVINNSFDRACIQIQQLHNETQRAITYPISDGVTTNLEIPSAVDRANKYFVFDGSGNPSVTTVASGVIGTSLALTATTASTNSLSGALTVAGGVGINKDSYINGLFIGTKTLTGATIVGANAMLSSTGLYNTAFGTSALASAGATSSGTAIGYGALQATTGNSSTGIGFQAGYNNGGSSVTAVGYNALYTNTKGGCSAVGVDALNTNTGLNSTAVGGSAGKTNSATTLSAFGYQSGFSNTGIYAVVIGSNSGYTNTGNYLTAVGQNSGYFNQGASNTAIGYFALSFSTGCTGGANVALGEGALQVNTSGSNNTAIGQRASDVNTTGNYNVVIGQLGAQSLTVGSSNVFIGQNTTAHAAAASNCIVIGQGGTSLANNTTVLGNSSILATKIFGVQATGQAAPTIASAATIAPTTSIVFISGAVAIVTITPPTGIATTGGQITLIPTGAFTTTTAGNIALATTAITNRALIMTYDATTTKWYPSYTI